MAKLSLTDWSRSASRSTIFSTRTVVGGAGGVVVGDDQVTAESVHGGADQLDPQDSAACLDELAEASQNLIWPVEYAGETE